MAILNRRLVGRNRKEVRSTPFRRFRSQRNRDEVGCLIRRMRGQGIVELTLAIPIFLVLLFGIFEFSSYYSTRM